MTEEPLHPDPALTRFRTRIADIRLVSRMLGRTLWQVSLESTAFRPGRDGWSCDTGVLLAASRSGAVLEVPVISVEQDQWGEVWHSVEKPLSSGTEVEGVINWPRHDPV